MAYSQCSPWPIFGEDVPKLNYLILLGDPGKSATANQHQTPCVGKTVLSVHIGTKDIFIEPRFDFFDEEEGDNTDRIEQEADDFALNTLIPPSVWEQCLSRFVLTEEAVLTDAENLGIDASIIAGRIRKERNDYTLLTRLVGQDAVRKQLESGNDT